MYSSSNFLEEQLPSTRKGVFWFLFKNHYFSFIKIGIILVLFAIPFFIVHFFKDYSYIVAHEKDISNLGDVLIYSAIEIPCLMLVSIPIAGFGKIYHEYAWLEPVFFLSDFKDGIKENIKPCLITAFIIGLLQFAFEWINCYQLSGWLLAIPFGFLVVIFFPLFMHTLFINFIYKNTYFVNFKLACYLYFKHIPTTLLFSLLICSFKVYDLFHFTNIIALLTKNLVFLVIFIFIMPFIFLGAQLNEMRIFDLRINSIRFPQLVNRGLYVKKDTKS